VLDETLRGGRFQKLTRIYQKAEREEKKRAKEEEKKKKDEEKAKKERSQLRLQDFLKTPSTPKKDRSIAVGGPLPASSVGASPGTRSMDAASPIAGASTPSARRRERRSDYEEYFLPFFRKEHTVVAPEHAFQRDAECRVAVNRALDGVLSLQDEGDEKGDPDVMDVDEAKTVSAGFPRITRDELIELLHIPPHKARAKRGRMCGYSTKDVMARINTPDDPGLPLLKPTISSLINSGEAKTSAYYVRLLNSLPHKYLKFAEDVRPPYVGTYSRIPTSSGLFHGRKPFQRALPGVNYDYDSEADWVADDEGEDLLSEDEDDKDSDGGDSLDGFLDDEDDDVGLKRGGMGVLMATNSGMCWQDANGKNPRPDLDEMRIEILLSIVVSLFITLIMC
jgi:chromatin assembly factor 1 subunit A